MIKKFGLILTALSLILSFPTYAHSHVKNKESKLNLQVKPRESRTVKVDTTEKKSKLDAELEENSAIQVKREVINLGGAGVKQEFSIKKTKPQK